MELLGCWMLCKRLPVLSLGSFFVGETTGVTRYRNDDMQIQITRSVFLSVILTSVVMVSCAGPDFKNPSMIENSETQDAIGKEQDIDPGAETTYDVVELVDGMERAFVFTSAPGKIVAYESAVVEILFAINEGHRVVGTHDFVEFPLEAASVTRVGDAFQINIEAVLELEPDLVFLSSLGFIDELEDAGLRVLFIPSRDSGLSAAAADIRLWGQIVGNSKDAEVLAVEFERRLANVSSILSGVDLGPRVFRDEGGLWTPGPDTLMGEVFELLKLENIAHDVSGFEQLSPEVIVARDPEVIIASDFSTIENDPAFANITATLNGRIIRMEGEPLSVAGPRFIQGIEDLAGQIYPELFP